MDDLVQWLGAQLDEDAARATQWHDLECEIHAHLDAGLLASVAAARMLDEVPGAVCDCGGPARVLREIGAKRESIRQADLYLCDAGPGCGYRTKHGHSVLRLLALPYADRPGYREEWRA
ncbi:DUF6221 family protein [Streptomyces sp. NPDC046821]|uniref:DUF6221 family protein n=1 Tax=Streptomyces sp. NPDC046821 TaxID=3154702 RepID=UPI0033DAC04A